MFHCWKPRYIPLAPIGLEIPPRSRGLELTMFNEQPLVNMTPESLARERRGEGIEFVSVDGHYIVLVPHQS
jgi:hypothetical protein